MASSISFPSSQSLPKDSSPRRLIFNGNTPMQPKSNVKRQAKTHRISPLFVIISLLTIVFMVVFFIWNKMSVNTLAGNLDKMQLEYQNIVGKNELLRSEVSQKSRPERIEKIAQEELGLIFRKEQPVLFQLDSKPN